MDDLTELEPGIFLIGHSDAVTPEMIAEIIAVLAAEGLADIVAVREDRERWLLDCAGKVKDAQYSCLGANRQERRGHEKKRRYVRGRMVL